MDHSKKESKEKSEYQNQQSKVKNDDSVKPDAKKTSGKASFSDNRQKNQMDKTRFDGTIGI